MHRIRQPLTRALVALAACLFAALLPSVAQAHTNYVTNLHVVSRTDTSIYLDWTQDYTNAYSGYYVRIDNGARIAYPASEGNLTGLKPGTQYRTCVSINYTAADHPDESPQTCIVPATTGTAQPPPTGIPMPPSSLWAPTSDWNTDVSSLPVRSDNATLINDLSARGNGFIFNRSYGVGVAFANASTPTYTVTNTRYQFDGVRAVSGVPIPSNFRVADGNDGHGTVIVNDPLSPKYGCVYDWFEGVPNSSGVETSASYFDMTRTDHSGWLGLTRGASANNLAGVLWPEHLNGTVPINFALGLWVDSARYLGGNALRPSKTTDGGGGSSKVPEGAKLRLRVGFDLSPYPAWLQRIGNALKTKGARVIDQHGDAPALMAVGYRNGTATTLPFSDPYGTGQLPVAFLRNMEVIAWNTADIQPQSYTVDPNTSMCGTLIR